MWSDECSAERGKGKAQEWCFGNLVDKWKPGFVSTYSKSKDISVMVWGCFWYEDGKIQRSQLYIMDRDFESKKHGYSANSYLEVLDENLGTRQVFVEDFEVGVRGVPMFLAFEIAVHYV